MGTLPVVEPPFEYQFQKNENNEKALSYIKNTVDKSIKVWYTMSRVKILLDFNGFLSGNFTEGGGHT